MAHRLSWSYSFSFDVQLPQMYRWRASEKAAYHIGDCSAHNFTSHRNRVELIFDFPNDNDREITSSLEVHPHGWCVLSRNTSKNENSEVGAFGQPCVRCGDLQGKNLCLHLQPVYFRCKVSCRGDSSDEWLYLQLDSS